MKLKPFHRIRTRSTRRGATATAATVSIAAGLVIAARVMYIFYNGARDVEGQFLAFRWLSSFLYSLGMEISMVLVGGVILYGTNFMQGSAVKPFRIFGWSVQAVGFYFISWMLLDAVIWNDTIEIFCSIALALLAVFLIFTFSRFVQTRYRHLVESVRSLFSFIFSETEKAEWIKDEKRDQFRRRRLEVTDKILDGE